MDQKENRSDYELSLLLSKSTDLIGRLSQSLERSMKEQMLADEIRNNYNLIESARNLVDSIERLNGTSLAKT